MTLRYDPEVDAAYSYIGPRLVRGEAVHQISGITNPAGRGEIILDFDKDGHLLGVEILEASVLLRPQAIAEAEDITAAPPVAPPMVASPSTTAPPSAVSEDN